MCSLKNYSKYNKHLRRVCESGRVTRKESKRGAERGGERTCLTSQATHSTSGPPWPLAKIHNYMAVIIMRVGAKFKQQNARKKEGRESEGGKGGREREMGGERDAVGEGWLKRGGAK